jgi:large subunit ribosomal protein L10
MKPVIELKEQETVELVNFIKESKSLLVFGYNALDAKSSTQLRKQLHAQGAKVYIKKNNILNRAFKNAGINDFNEIHGPSAIIIASGDEIAPFKEISIVISDGVNITFKGGILENKFINASQLAAIASLPTREGLYSMLLSCLQGSLRNLMYGIKAVGEKK